MAIFKGLSAFPITPADQDGHVDTNGLCHLLTRLKDAQVQSIGLLGSTGGYAYLSKAERQRAIEAAAECLGQSIPLIVGVGALRTDDAQALARDAERLGANGLLLAPVSYTPLTDEEVYQHYLAVAGETGLPLCIYNNPSTTHFSFSLSLLARLADIPNICAVKMPLPADADFGSEIGQLRRMLPDDFAIGYSGDWECAQALLDGADTWYSVIGGILPTHAVTLTQAAQAGDFAEVQRINGDLQPLWSLFKEFGSLRVVYAIAHLLSLTAVAPPRPILPLSASNQQRVAKVLKELGALP